MGIVFEVECDIASIHARSSGTDLVLRFELDPLRSKPTMIDACVDVEFGKARIAMVHLRAFEADALLDDHWTAIGAP